MPTIDFSGTDRPALLYIKEKGYASYSSLKLVRDKEVPSTKRTDWGDFGVALHAHLLEGMPLKKFRLNSEQVGAIKVMVKNLKANTIVKKLLAKSKNEVQFKKKINGLTLFGYIDILTFAIADLKSTRHTNGKRFIEEMDFLQAAVYLRVTGLKDFYYLGVSKNFPHDVFIYNVNEFPVRIKKANQELDRLIDYIPAAIKKLK